MAEGYWVIRTYEAGWIGEKTKYWVPGAKPSRSERRRKSEVKKQEQNEYSAVKNMARLMNANYGGGDDLIGLDYSDEGLARLIAWLIKQGVPYWTMDEAGQMEAVREAAEHELRNCLRRVKRELAKEGKVDLTFIAITSDMDGETGEAVRVHHHLMVPAGCREAFLKRWKQGGVDWVALTDQVDYTPIAEYFLRQVRKVPDAKKYITSRNLFRPEPKDRVAITDCEVRPPRGAELLHRSEFKPGRPQYIRYALSAEKRHPRGADLRSRGVFRHDNAHTGGRDSN